jgi:outer membrane biosynthesis protein TonB
MVKRRAEGWGKAVPVKRRAVMMVVLAVLAGCSTRAPQKKVETLQQNVGAVRSSPVVEAPKAQADACGLEAYPFPRSYEQALADAAQDRQKRRVSPQLRMVIDADGNITHLRFTRLSSLDSVNKQAFESVKKWHYEPTVLNGERVSVCSTVDVTVDF